jgi:Carbonic anhydrase
MTSTPQGSYELLKQGNYRFVNNLKINRNLLQQVNETKDGQKPFAAIVSCMDSRTSAELIFDLGLGDIFSIRIAGNVITDGILGSLEYATEVVGSKLIMVLGHTNCGAIKGACDHVEMGHLTGLLKHITPAVENETTTTGDRSSNNTEFVNTVAALNVDHAVKQIMERSEIIRKLVDAGKVGIAAAMYDVSTGEVTFHDEYAVMPQKTVA